jgi:GMP synthase (glutamine-hydrolysing)
VLIHEAIGDQLTCVFVDHGLMREGEAEEVVGSSATTTTSRSSTSMPPSSFLGALEGVDRSGKEAQDDRAIFIDVFEAKRKRSAA